MHVHHLSMQLVQRLKVLFHTVLFCGFWEFLDIVVRHQVFMSHLCQWKCQHVTVTLNRCIQAVYECYTHSRKTQLKFVAKLQM